MPHRPPWLPAASNTAFADSIAARCADAGRPKICDGRITRVELPSDHAFADSRITLIEHVAAWLAELR